MTLIADEALWLHPSVAGKHVVRMTRDHAEGKIFSVATCQCGWVNRLEIPPADRLRVYAQGDLLIEAHWREAIAADESATDEPIDGDDFPCTNPGGHEFVCTGTAYGGDDPSYHGEGRMYCEHCGADGDA